MYQTIMEREGPVTRQSSLCSSANPLSNVRGYFCFTCISSSCATARGHTCMILWTQRRVDICALQYESTLDKYNKISENLIFNVRACVPACVREYARVYVCACEKKETEQSRPSCCFPRPGLHRILTTQTSAQGKVYHTSLAWKAVNFCLP